MRKKQDPRTRVRLTRKYADVIDGIDITDAHVGDQLELRRRDAELLIAEGWAERERPPRRPAIARANAADGSASPKRRSRR